MTREKKTREKWILIVLYILTASTIAFAWIHSAMPVPASQAESGAVLKLLGPFLKVFLPDEWVTDALVRKLAHFSEYGLLGVELLCIRRVKDDITSKTLINTLYFGFSVAFVDETIQIFSGRGPLIADVWIDLAGFACGGIFVLIIIKIVQKLSSR